MTPHFLGTINFLFCLSRYFELQNSPCVHKTAKDRMTERQRKLLSDLIRKRIPRREQGRWYQEMEDFSKFEASEALSSMLLSVGR